MSTFVLVPGAGGRSRVQIPGCGTSRSTFAVGAGATCSRAACASGLPGTARWPRAAPVCPGRSSRTTRRIIAWPFAWRGVSAVHSRSMPAALVAFATGSYLAGKDLDDVHRVVRTEAADLVRLLEDDDLVIAVVAAGVVAGLPDPPTTLVDALADLSMRVTGRDHVAAVALASWCAGQEPDKADVWHAVVATEDWLEDDLDHLRGAGRLGAPRHGGPEPRGGSVRPPGERMTADRALAVERPWQLSIPWVGRPRSRRRRQALVSEEHEP